jgi:hypothetical protein
MVFIHCVGTERYISKVLAPHLYFFFLFSSSLPSFSISFLFYLFTPSTALILTISYR